MTVPAELVPAELYKHGEISNVQVRSLLRTTDTLRASKALKEWVNLGLLVVANPSAAKQNRRYTKSDVEPGISLFSFDRENSQ